MDTQQQEIKKSPSGRESQGVYLCHKCGWPFAKAHPSAKHRRAHKKVCGTIEGYKLVESDDHLAVSDGEHASGEDQRTPIKRGVKELGSSGGNSLQSNRSVDDMFSDAVAEFSDSGTSPAIEDHIKDLSKDMEKLAHNDSVEGQTISVEATAGTQDNPIAPKQSIKTFDSEVEEQVISQSQNANPSSEAITEESPIASIEVTALQFDESTVIFESPEHYSSSTLDNPVATKQSIKAFDSKVEEEVTLQSQNASPSSEAKIEESPVASIGVTALQPDESHVVFETPKNESIEGIDADAKGTLDNPIAPKQSIKTSNSEVAEQVISQSEIAKSFSETRIKKSPIASIGVTDLHCDASPVLFGTPTDELLEGIDAVDKVEEINKTLTDSLNPQVEATRESSEPHSSIEGTPDNPIALIQSIKTLNSEIDKKVISQSGNANSSSEARIEDSPVEAIGVSALPFDTSPVTFETPSDELTEDIDADVKDEEINKSFLNPVVEAARESSEPNLNEIDKQFSDNIWEEESTPLTVIENLSKFEASENKNLDFVTQDTPVENDASPLEKHLYMKNSVTEFDGNKSGDQSEVHHISEHSGEGKDSDVSLFREKEETIVSNLEEHNKADIAIYTLSVPDSLAAIANVAYLNEDLKDNASQESNLPLDLGSSEVITYVGDDKQSTIAGHNVSKDNLTEKEVKNHINKARVSGSTEETTNLVTVDDPDQCKMSKSEESDEGIKQYNKRPMEDQLSANDKIILGADSSILLKDNQITSSKVHHNQVLKEAVVELSELSVTIENSKVGHESAGPTQKSGDRELHQMFDSRGNMEQIASLSSKGAYTLSQLGTENVTDNTFSVASAVKNIERMSVSEKQGAFVTNEVASLPVGFELLIQTSNMVNVTPSSQASKEYPGCGSESLQGKGKDKVGTRGGVSVSIASSSRADSMDGNWGSVSVASMQSDASANTDTGVPLEKSQTSSLPVHKDAAGSHTVKLDDYEPPSFMTLIEPGNVVPQKDSPPDLSALTTQQQKDADPKAGRFPTISNVMNESQGRKKNEEIIDRVSSWGTGKRHSPLKSLLGEARSPNSKRRSSVTEGDEISLKNNVVAVTTVDSILRSELNGKEMEKEWNSPARYPVEIKKEKRKKKLYWVQFVCCLSAQRDL